MTQKLDFIDYDNLSRGIDYSGLEDRTYKQELLYSLKNSPFRIIWFAGLFMYLETVFHIWAFQGISPYFILKLLWCIPTAVIFSLLSSYFPPRVNRIVTDVLTGLIVILYIVNTLYHAIFKVFFSISFIEGTNMKFVQYYREIIKGIQDNWLVLALMVIVPAAALIVLNVLKIFKYRRLSWKCIYIHFGYILVLFGIIALIIPIYGKDSFSAYDLVKHENISEYSMDKLGVTATHEIEIRNIIIPRKDEFEEDLGVWVYDPNAQKGESKSSTESSVSSGNDTPAETTSSTSSETSSSASASSTDGSASSEVSSDTSVIKEIVEEIDTSPNMLNIDFVKLAEEETNENVAAIHKYMASLEPTYKNKYTGMFKGFNLIFMTAEGFSSLAVDETHTPTLWKLTHEGFVFNNFYNPRTGGSTSDGEFVCSTSLVPTNRGATNFRIVGQNSMPFSLGNMFNRTYGITSRAYHDNDYMYYGRDITYPGMGYYFKGVGNGLDIPKHWPASDLHMMEASLPDYIDDEIFNIYYMTVSGHLNYNFAGNWCAKIHQQDVEDLPYSEGPRAYIACNMELDRALEYLINQLEEKGIADRTVICFTGDHWPYGLENDEISEILGHPVEENFELYKSNLILWSGAIKEPIVIDKVCGSYDILPTLCNLFGLEYDSRLFMGRDILSDTEGYVIFMYNRSLMTDKASFNARTGEVVNFTDEELPEDYIKNMRAILNARWKYSQAIMDTDYYSYIAKELGIDVVAPEQNYKPDYSRFTKK
ncbi:MAG: LTA synthase family protein [Lachnospiraceae bacterium]|nr:LTA synthase family protein [Lachnospiraceae bacterium]